MVRPADTPRRAEEGNPLELNDRINPNNNNERARNAVRSRHFTRRNTRATSETVRDRVVTNQIIQNMNGPRRRPANVNVEHNSMVLRSRQGGVPHNLRETRNQPRRKGFTTVRSTITNEGLPTAADLLETLRPGSSDTAPQPGTSRAAEVRRVPNIQRPGTSHELGTISLPGNSTSGASRSRDTETTSSSHRDSRRSREIQGRVFIPPPYWRPDLEDESSSDEDIVTNALPGDNIRPCLTFNILTRMQIPTPVPQANRIAEEERLIEARLTNQRDRPNESHIQACLRPRPDDTSRMQGEDDFVPAGYFPNPGSLINIQRPQAMNDGASTSIGHAHDGRNSMCINKANTPRNFVKTRNIRQEVRENLRALVNSRRDTARFQGRQLSIDDTAEEEREETHRQEVASTSGTAKDTKLGKRKRACGRTFEPSINDTPNDKHDHTMSSTSKRFKQNDHPTKSLKEEPEDTEHQPRGRNDTTIPSTSTFNENEAEVDNRPSRSLKRKRKGEEHQSNDEVGDTLPSTSTATENESEVNSPSHPTRSLKRKLKDEEEDGKSGNSKRRRL